MSPGRETLSDRIPLSDLSPRLDNAPGLCDLFFMGPGLSDLFFMGPGLSDLFLPRKRFESRCNGPGLVDRPDRSESFLSAAPPRRLMGPTLRDRPCLSCIGPTLEDRFLTGPGLADLCCIGPGPADRFLIGPTLDDRSRSVFFLQ